MSSNTPLPAPSTDQMVPAAPMAPPAPTAAPVAPAPSVEQRVLMAEATALGQAKSTGIAYLLWFFLGGLGIHKFYLGRVGMGIAYLFTFGFLTIGLWIDLFTLPRQVRQANEVRRAQIRTQMGV